MVLNNKYTIADLFAGIGGMSLGLKEAGAEIVWANEIDKNACKLYKGNMPEVDLIEGDVCKIDIDIVPKFDILVSGFLSQAFSVSGIKGRGMNDENRDLFFQILRFIERKKPKAFILENTKGLLNYNAGESFKIILECLENKGYSLQYGLLNTMTHGNIPQNRERLYIVGFSDKQCTDKFYFPEPIKLNKTVHDIIDIEEKKDDYYYQVALKDLERNANLKLNSLNGVLMMEGELCPTLTPNRKILVEDKHGIRRLTIGECLHMQGFLKYVIKEDRHYARNYNLIANSSPVPVVQKIAQQIISVLDGKSSISQKSNLFKDSTGKINNEPEKFENRKIPIIHNVQNRDKLEELLLKVEEEQDKYKKGKVLEDLMVEFFSRVNGFKDIKSNIRTETEEIDIVIVNKSDNHVFRREEIMILAECKNWNKKVERCNLDSLEKKISNRRGRCTLGFFISWNGVTSCFEKELLRGSRDNVVIVVLDKNKIKDAVKSKNIEKFLEEALKKAILD